MQTVHFFLERSCYVKDVLRGCIKRKVVIAVQLSFSSTLRQEWKHLLWFPLYLVSYLVLERIPVSTLWLTQTALDSHIPFAEWFVVPYCLWYPLLIGVGVYLLLRDVPAFRRYMRFLCVTFFLSVLIWYLIPNGQGLRPAVMPRDNLFTALIAMLYQIDTCTNVFPSVHVVGSLGALFAVWDSAPLRRRKAVCWAVTLLAALICVSTVFIKQHAIVDVFGGLALAFAAAVPIYGRSVAHLCCRSEI